MSTIKQNVKTITRNSVSIPVEAAATTLEVAVMYPILRSVLSVVLSQPQNAWAV